MTHAKLFSWGALIGGRWLLYLHSDGRDLQVAQRYAYSPCDGQTVVYCDGSGTTGEKPSGIGVVVYEPGCAPQLIAENIGPGTNNRAELAAIWRGLKAIPDITRRVIIRSDSEYAAGVLTKDWTLKSNVELITAIREDLALRGDRVSFEYVPGHEGVEGNELADRLANMGRKLVTAISPL